MKYDVNNREIYERKWVVDTTDTQLAVRNYIEQRDLRCYLNIANNRKKIMSAAEFGCGYGRMSQVLTEFTTNVVGLERELFLVEEAAQLIPSVNFVQTDNLTQTNQPDNCFDIIISFTFLQHLIDDVAAAVTKEMMRCLMPGGHILICEETDINHQMGDPSNPNKICTIGRTIEHYSKLFSPLTLLFSAKRHIEPGYDRDNIGDYMLFG